MELYILNDTFRRTKVVDKYESLIWTERFNQFGDFELTIQSTIDNTSLFAKGTKLGLNLSLRVMTVQTVEKKTDAEGKRLLVIKGRSLEDILFDRIAKKSTVLANVSMGTVTVSAANPAVVTLNAHGLVQGDVVYFTTTGDLYDPLTANVAYYVIPLTVNTFKLATTYASAMTGTPAIKTNSTGNTQSGVHTLWKINNTNWQISGTSGDIARYIFQKICVDGQISSFDILPNYSPGNLFPADDIPEEDSSITVDFAPGTVYEIIKEILDQYDLGFRLYRGLDDQHIYFNVYSGCDRSTNQSVHRSVVFSPNLDNLSDTSELSSIIDYKNIAHVVSANGSMFVYGIGADETTAGFNRHVIFVDASSVTDLPGAVLDQKLQALGEAALTEHRSLSAFDGEVPQNSKYTYMVDYNLGDIVEKRGEDGVVDYMRVTEQIFIDDAEGERSYPTLSTNQLVTPGSWLATDSNLDWEDALGTWSTA